MFWIYTHKPFTLSHFLTRRENNAGVTRFPAHFSIFHLNFAVSCVHLKCPCVVLAAIIIFDVSKCIVLPSSFFSTFGWKHPRVLFHERALRPLAELSPRLVLLKKGPEQDILWQKTDLHFESHPMFFKAHLKGTKMNLSIPGVVCAHVSVWDTNRV